MAVSYTFAQAYRVIAEGKDAEAMADIARRFPMVTVYCAKLASDFDVASKLFDSFPDYLTARKVEKGLRVAAGVSGDADEATEVEPDHEEVEEKPKAKRRGRKPKATAEPEPEPDEAEDDGDDSKYAGKNAMELFKECKKRGIKVAPKKPAAFYIDILEKADAEAGASDDQSDDDDDWDL